MFWPFYRYFVKAKPIPEVSLALVQVTLVYLVVSGLIYPNILPLELLSPPLIAWFKFSLFSRYSLFMALPLGCGLLAAAIVFSSWRRLVVQYKTLAWFVASSTFCGVTFAVAPYWSNYLQDRKLADFQPDCVERFSFWHSMQIAGEEIQFQYHLLAFKGGVPYGWSFSELDLYRIPPTVGVSAIAGCKSYQSYLSE